MLIQYKNLIKYSKYQNQVLVSKKSTNTNIAQNSLDELHTKIKKNPHLLSFSWVDQNLHDWVMKKQPNMVVPIQDIPVLTQELCDQLVKKDPNIFLLLPNQFKSASMCLSMLREKNFRDYIRFIPDSIFTSEFLCEILQSNDYDKSRKITCIKEKIMIQKTKLSTLFDANDIKIYVTNNDPFMNIPVNIFRQFDLSVFVDLVMTGAQFDKYFSHLRITEFLKCIQCHNRYQTSIKYNTEKNFNFIKDYLGGIYFAIHLYDDKGKTHTSNPFECFMEAVRIPDDALIKFGYMDIVTDKLILGSYFSNKYKYIRE